MYVLVYGVVGWDWLWVGLGLIRDIMEWVQIDENRHATPYDGETVVVD